MNEERYINPKNIDLKLGALEADGEILIPLSAVRAAIAAAPSEDVVKVVRCQECVWRIVNTEYCTQHHRGCWEKGFCDRGERRTNDEQAD